MRTSRSDSSPLEPPALLIAIGDGHGAGENILGVHTGARRTPRCCHAPTAKRHPDPARRRLSVPMSGNYR